MHDDDRFNQTREKYSLMKLQHDGWHWANGTYACTSQHRYALNINHQSITQCVIPIYNPDVWKEDRALFRTAAARTDLRVVNSATSVLLQKLLHCPQSPCFTVAIEYRPIDTIIHRLRTNRSFNFLRLSAGGDGSWTRTSRCERQRPHHLTTHPVSSAGCIRCLSYICA